MFIPIRGCELKFVGIDEISIAFHAHPHAGVWVEIESATKPTKPTTVHPHAGVWVEIIHVQC